MDVITTVCEKVANSVGFIYGPCTCTRPRTGQYRRPCTRPLHRRLHGPYEAHYRAVYTAVYGPSTLNNNYAKRLIVTGSRHVWRVL